MPSTQSVTSFISAAVIVVIYRAHLAPLFNFQRPLSEQALDHSTESGKKIKVLCLNMVLYLSHTATLPQNICNRSHNQEAAMASYIYSLFSGIWNGGGATSDEELEEDFLDNLRPRHVLKKPGRLPDTPTKAHQAPAKRVQKDNGVSTRKCPHCKYNININFRSGRMTKPKARGPQSKAKRWITVREKGEEYLVEDRSPAPKLRPNRRVQYY